MEILNQRDSRWASELLGFSKTSTIGNFGCTITALAMFAGITPSQVNQRLKSVGGFQDDLILWAKIKEAMPWMEFEWRGYFYENDRVAEAIKKWGACLVEVDFDGKISTPSDRHWVLYTGNQRMIDPWTGVEKSTSYYPLTKGYSIIKKLGEPMTDSYKGFDPNNPESCKVGYDALDDLMNGRLVRKEELTSCLKTVKENDEVWKERVNNEKKNYDDFIRVLAEKLSSVQQEPAIIEQVTRLLNSEDKVAEELEPKIKALEERVTSIARTLGGVSEGKIEETIKKLMKTGEVIIPVNGHSRICGMLAKIGL